MDSAVREQYIHLINTNTNEESDSDNDLSPNVTAYESPRHLLLQQMAECLEKGLTEQVTDVCWCLIAYDWMSKYNALYDMNKWYIFLTVLMSCHFIHIHFYNTGWLTDTPQAMALRDEFALLTQLRADPTQTQGSYDRFLDQDDWYMKARRKSMK